MVKENLKIKEDNKEKQPAEIEKSKKKARPKLRDRFILETTEGLIFD